MPAQTTGGCSDATRHENTRGKAWFVCKAHFVYQAMCTPLRKEARTYPQELSSVGHVRQAHTPHLHEVACHGLGLVDLIQERVLHLKKQPRDASNP